MKSSFLAVVGETSLRTCKESQRHHVIDKTQLVRSFRIDLISNRSRHGSPNTRRLGQKMLTWSSRLPIATRSTWCVSDPHTFFIHMKIARIRSTAYLNLEESVSSETMRCRQLHR